MSLVQLGRYLALLRLDAQTRVGLTGFIGAALLAGAVTTAWLAPRMQDETRELQARVEATRRRMADADRARPPLDAAGQAAQFRAWFPRSSQSHEDLRALFRLAGDHRITLARGEYAAAIRRDARLTSYDVVLPVRAAYPAVRGFVAAALNALPHASLAELRLERGASTADIVDARVHLTLYYRADESGEAP